MAVTCRALKADASGSRPGRVQRDGRHGRARPTSIVGRSLVSGAQGTRDDCKTQPPATQARIACRRDCRVVTLLPRQQRLTVIPAEAEMMTANNWDTARI